MKSKNDLYSAIFVIALGLLLLFFKVGFINWLVVAVGVLFVVLGLIDLFKNKLAVIGITEGVAGLLIVIFASALTSVAFYLIAAALLIKTAINVYMLADKRIAFASKTDKVIAWACNVGLFVIAILLLFNQGGTLNWIFTVAGVLCLVDGVLMLLSALSLIPSKKSKKK